MFSGAELGVLSFVWVVCALIDKYKNDKEELAEAKAEAQRLEVDRIRLENVRLREALEKIAWTEDLESREIAKSALSPETGTDAHSPRS